MKDNTINECKNCGSENLENYCSKCGQLVYHKRFTLKSIFGFFLDVFNVEKGFINTAKMLLIKPGTVIKDYLNGKTKVYMNPLKFFLIIAGINAAIMIYFKIFDHNIERNTNLAGANEIAIQLSHKMSEIMKKYLHIIGIFIIPFISIMSKWFFRKKKLYYAEHLIINLFLSAELAIFAFFLNFFYYYFPLLYDYSLLVNFLLIATYISWSFSQIFDTSKFKAFIGALFANYLGQFLFIFAFVLIFLIVLYFLKLMGFSLKEILGIT